MVLSCPSVDPKKLTPTHVRNRILKAASAGAKVVFLPESSDFMSETREETLHLTKDLASNIFVQGLKREAEDRRIWISAGVHETSEDPSRVYNVQILIDDRGNIVQRYRKIHMFDVEMPGVKLLESASTMPGDMLETPVQTPLGFLALQTCYDVRFPEAAIALRSLGAEIITYPSAFTVRTGYSHWETLLRARAIETQCYVVAAAQIGKHNSKRESYGHSCIVDPWGTVIAQCNDKEQAIALADIDLSYLKRVRMAMPVLQHRRESLYKV